MQEDVERLVYCLSQVEWLIVQVEGVVLHLSEVQEVVDQVLNHRLREEYILDVCL